MNFENLSVYSLFKIEEDKAERIYKKINNFYDKDNCVLLKSKYKKQCYEPQKMCECQEIIKVEG